MEEETRKELKDNVAKGQCYLGGDWSYVIINFIKNGSCANSTTTYFSRQQPFQRITLSF